MRAHAPHHSISRGRLQKTSSRHAIRLAGPERPSGRTATCGITPSTIMSPASTTRPRTEIRLGTRAHRPDQRRPAAHSPPHTNAPQPNTVNPDAALGTASPDR